MIHESFNRFLDIGVLKAENRQFCLPWPWNRVRGHSRSLILVPMESAWTHSY